LWRRRDAGATKTAAIAFASSRDVFRGGCSPDARQTLHVPIPANAVFRLERLRFRVKYNMYVQLGVPIGKHADAHR
jgi:hypothetical protein